MKKLALFIFVFEGLIYAQPKFSKEEGELYLLLTKYRQKEGETGLLFSPALTKCAQNHSQDMFKNNHLNEKNSKGDNLYKRCCALNYKDACKKKIQEIRIGGQYEIPASVLGIFEEDSNKNILLNPEWQAVGVGGTGEQDIWKWSIIFGPQKDGNLCKCKKEDPPQPCETPCGKGEKRCIFCAFRECMDYSNPEKPRSLEPKEEICDDIDNDCDGKTDEDNVCKKNKNGDSKDGPEDQGCEWGRCNIARQKENKTFLISFLCLWIIYNLKRRLQTKK